MRLQRKSDQKIITIEPTSILGHGGEARVFAVPGDDTLVAKVYHKVGGEREQKLAAMLANPPENPMAGQGHISIAWPIDILQTVGGGNRSVGFLMPRVKGMHSLLEFYNPKTRRQICPFFNYLYLHRTARNIAAAVGALHARGYSIGDVNESNILVGDTALVTLVDTDSFQVRNPHNGKVYRCPVGKPEFTPPELQGKNFGQLDRIPEHDLFGLAVLIFQLLMEGTHPFSGIFQGSGDPPPYEARIAAGHFSYSVGRQVPYVPTRIAPKWESLHPTLRQLFVQCFQSGHQNPQQRPSAQAWQAALKEAETALVTCSVNSQHRYGNHLKTCPWCERTVLLGGRDPFPSAQAVQQRLHLKPLPKKRVTPVYRRTPTPVMALQTPRTLNRSRYLATSHPTYYKRRSRRGINPMTLGLFCTGLSVGVFGIMAMVIVSDLKLGRDHSVTFSQTTNPPTTIPPVASNGGDSFLSFYNQGNASYKLGDYDTAIKNFSQALQLNPRDASAFVNRGNARYEAAQHSGEPEKQYQAAIADFNQALKLKPQDASALISRGSVRYDVAQYSKDPEKEYSTAIADFNQALNLNPRATEAYVKRGVVRYKLAQSRGDFNQGYKLAIADFNQALNLNPQEAKAYVKRGIVRYELAQYSGDTKTDYWEAVADLQKAAKLFLEQGNIEDYQLALGSICVALEKNCDSFLRTPEKFILSTPQSLPIEPKSKLNEGI